MSQREPTLADWPPAIMMPRAEHDPIRLAHDVFDRLDMLADKILEHVEEEPPPTDRSPNWWEP